MKKIYERLNIIGCDETGVGDYLTPLVAAAVFVPWKNVSILIKMGITDSKKISNLKIRTLAERIRPIVISSVKHLTQKGYNKLNESLNAHELKTFLHLANINQVEEKIKDAHMIIIDEYASEKLLSKYISHLQKMHFGFKAIKTKSLKLVKKGELEHVSVAAASILARDKLLSLMDKQNETWRMTFPLGTNNIVESCARNFIAEYGKDSLGEVAKIQFKTTKKILE